VNKVLTVGARIAENL